MTVTGTRLRLMSAEMDESVFEFHASECVTICCKCLACERHRTRTAMTERPVHDDEPDAS